MIPAKLRDEITCIAERRGMSEAQLIRVWVEHERKNQPSPIRSLERELILECIQETILVLNPANELVYANGRPKEELGIDLREMQGQPLESILSQGPLGHIDHPPILQAIRRVRQGKQDEERIGVSVPLSSEQVIHLEVRITRPDSDLDWVILVARDMSQRVQTQKKLRERETRLQGLAHSIPGVVYQFYARPDGTYGTHFVSVHAEDVLGISSDPKNFYSRFLERVPESHQDQLLDSIDEAVDQQAPWSFEMPFVKPSGERIWLQGLSTPTHRKEELVFNGVILEITQRKEHERQLIEAKKEAEMASRMRSALIENMSHELRTPLTAVLGFADLLIEELEPPWQEHARSIRQGGKRLEGTLETVLDLAQLEGEELEFDSQPIDAMEVVRKASLAHQADAQRKGLHLQMEDLSGKRTAVIDPRILTRITSHLVSNAIKFTEEGVVTISLEQRDTDLLLRVKDTGIGLSKEAQNRIFRPFYQESSGWTREYEGVGLGLTVVKRLTELANGWIDLKSQPGSGTIISVGLPQQPAPQDNGNSSTMSHTSSSGQPADSEHILVVEDDRAMRDLIQEFLSDKVDLEMAEGPQSARACIESGQFDVVLMDINLQAEETGIDLLNHIRGASTPPLPSVIAMTAYAMPGDAESFREQGFDDYIAKPFTREELQRCIQEAE